MRHLMGSRQRRWLDYLRSYKGKQARNIIPMQGYEGKTPFAIACTVAETKAGSREYFNHEEVFKLGFVDIQCTLIRQPAYAEPSTGPRVKCINLRHFWDVCDMTFSEFAGYIEAHADNVFRRPR